MEIQPTRGGFRKPIRVKEFIVDYLAAHGEAYIAEMHRAYKGELRRLAEENPNRVVMSRGGPRVRLYHNPSYHSFQVKVWELAREGLLEFSRSEPTIGLDGQFKGFANLPERHYYKLKA